MDTTKKNIIQTQLNFLRNKLNETATGISDTEYINSLMIEVNNAIEKLDHGTYGICELCHEAIEGEYIHDNTLARICLEHLTREQQSSIERDLELANRIQNKLLPSRFINSSGWEMSYHYEPAGIVSGDICDIIKTDGEDSDTYFLIGDVTGKGVSAALLMSHLNAIFRTIAGMDVPLNRIVERANKQFCENTLSTHFATLIFGKAFPDGMVELCNAGHCLPYHISDGKISCLKSNGLPLGIFCDSTYTMDNIMLGKGEILFLYTDGITENKNDYDEIFGENRLEKNLTGKGTMSTNELIKVLLKDLDTFRNNTPIMDDMTIMAIKRQ